MTIASDGLRTEAFSIDEMTKALPMVFSCKFLPFPEEKKNEAFKIIKQHLLDYPYVAVDFDDKQYTFKVYHQEKEVQSLIQHLKLDRYFNLNAISYTQSPKTMSFYAPNVIMSLEDSGYLLFNKSMKQLLKSAQTFYASHDRVSVTIPDEQQAIASEIFSSLLKKHDGLCIGEYYHSDFTPKAMAIRHMEELYHLGVRTLYVEHIYYDSMYQSLAVDKVIPPHVELYLRKLDCGQQVKSTRYNFLNLIKKAHEVGIRVVPIDTSVSYACGSHRKKGVKSNEERVAGMNFVATRIIEEEQKKVSGKYVAFMGVTHLCEHVEGLPGVSELLRVPSLLLTDGKEEILTYNTTPEVLKKPVSVFLQSKVVSRRIRKRRLSSNAESYPSLKRQKSLLSLEENDCTK